MYVFYNRSSKQNTLQGLFVCSYNKVGYYYLWLHRKNEKKYVGSHIHVLHLMSHCLGTDHLILSKVWTVWTINFVHSNVWTQRYGLSPLESMAFELALGYTKCSCVIHLTSHSPMQLSV